MGSLVALTSLFMFIACLCAVFDKDQATLKFGLVAVAFVVMLTSSKILFEIRNIQEECVIIHQEAEETVHDM